VVTGSVSSKKKQSILGESEMMKVVPEDEEENLKFHDIEASESSGSMRREEPVGKANLHLSQFSHEDDIEELRKGSIDTI
jgi:hypothetical protein